MGQRTSYPPGTFSYAELATGDAAAAKDFYAGLFGWEYEDVPMGDDEQVYTLVFKEGSQVAALYASDDQPPHWNCYVTVTSVEGSAATAGEHGGSVVARPFDVMGLGRMAVIADPGGAALCLWEPHTHIGAQLVNTPGAMTWNDLVTSDPEAAARFYGVLFGWRVEQIPNAGGYRLIYNGERTNGGIMPVEAGPTSWMPYFGHEDVERVAAEIEGRGGRLFNGPLQMPKGAVAIVADPQGAVFAVWTGEYDD
jgi:predicted enzyme related to lactoylglutathione lyase